MKNLKRDLIPLSFMVSILISLIFYKILNNGNGNVSSLVTNIDKEVPFLKVFILPYVTWYGYILVGLVYLCAKNREIYYTSLISLNTSLVICYIIYATFQTTVPRPIITDTDILSKLVTIIYKYDNPFNCFPSMHVTTTYVVMRGIKQTENTALTSFIFNIVGVLIIISTQFVKQHVVLDLIFALLLCEVIFRIVDNAMREGFVTWKRRLSSIFPINSKLKNPS